jgi:tetratricopeptide (TPR) repeat protein
VQAIPPPAPSDDAVRLFDQGMQALQRHQYQRAAEHFRAILAQFSVERGLCDRSQVYLALCERELRRTPTSLTTIEERLTAATAALNDDDEAAAEALAKQVLADAPQQDLAMYLMAAVAARRGDQDGAIEWLERAIRVGPELRAQARHDEDFAELRGLDAFHRLLDLPAAAFRGQRRARAER